jgi:hypothetical protein
MACMISSCLVKDCRYNVNLECQADSIEIRPSVEKAVVSVEDTSCSTFKPVSIYDEKCPAEEECCLENGITCQ